LFADPCGHLSGRTERSGLWLQDIWQICQCHLSPSRRGSSDGIDRAVFHDEVDHGLLFGCIASNEMSCAASVEAGDQPEICCGKKPFRDDDEEIGVSREIAAKDSITRPGGR